LFPGVADLWPNFHFPISGLGLHIALIYSMSVWQGVVMDSLKFHPTRYALTFYVTGRAACDRFLPLWTPHAAPYAYGLFPNEFPPSFYPSWTRAVFCVVSAFFPLRF
jgi:hypothetical protein